MMQVNRVVGDGPQMDTSEQIYISSLALIKVTGHSPSPSPRPPGPDRGPPIPDGPT